MPWPSSLARTKNWGTEILTDTDLEGQFDLIINYINDMMSSTTGHKHDATASEGPKILVSDLDLTSAAAGDILYHNGTNLVRLAKGTSLQLLRQNSGLTAPEWASYSGFVTAANALAGSVVQVVNTITGAAQTGSTTLPNDDTIPQNTEGFEVMTLAITPNSATNKLKIDIVAHVSHASDSLDFAAALFQDTTANALAVGSIFQHTAAGNYANPIVFTHYMAAGTTSATTFKVRVGSATAGTVTFNGWSGARKYGGVYASSITISEIKV